MTQYFSLKDKQLKEALNRLNDKVYWDNLRKEWHQENLDIIEYYKLHGPTETYKRFAPEFSKEFIDGLVKKGRFAITL